MSAYAASLMLLIGLIAGFAVAWLLRGHDTARLKTERADAARRGDSLARALQDEKIARAAIAAERDAEARAHDKNMAALGTLRGDVETKLKALAAEVLRDSNLSF